MTLRGCISLIVCLSISTIAFSKSAGKGFDQLMSEEIKAKLTEVQPLAIVRVSPRYLTPAVTRFYQQRHFRRAWNKKTLTQLVANIEELEFDGLHPQDYALSQLKNALQIINMRNKDALTLRVHDELQATHAYLTAIFHLYYGKVDQQSNQAQWQFELQKLSDIFGDKRLHEMNVKNINALFMQARPDHIFYRGLKKGLQYYKNLEKAGGWPILPNGSLLKPCVIDPQIAIVRQRLQITGEYRGVTHQPIKTQQEMLSECFKAFPSKSSASSFSSSSISVLSFNKNELYDVQLVKAVIRFQEEQYLDIDSTIGPSTRAALNISVQARIDQIRVNLDRARSLLRQISSDLVLVDVAGFKLTYYQSSKPVWKSRVQVGMAYRSTPIFRSEIHYITLNPSWTIPPGILKKDVLPKIQQNRNFLTKNKLKVYDATGKAINSEELNWFSPGNIILRQDVGDGSALGKAVIRFPNEYSVYLHDTPHQRLFKKSQRAFSSGCIRVENILELVELLLRNNKDMDKKAIDDILQSGKTRNVVLNHYVPVMLAYWTVDLKDNDKVVFKPDIYARDQLALQALNQQ